MEWIRLRGRWKVATSLEHYVQEAVAWLLQNQLSEKAKGDIKNKSELCWLLVQASISELFASFRAGIRVQADLNEVPAMHPIRRRLLAPGSRASEGSGS